MHLRTHGQLDYKPGGIPEDEGRDEVPVDDVSQAADAPVRDRRRERESNLSAGETKVKTYHTNANKRFSSNRN